VPQALKLTRDQRPRPPAATSLYRANKFNERGLVLNDFEDRYNSSLRPAWARVWHIWHLIIPRRAIDGAIICGRVWRRHDGRRWIYKPIVDFEQQ
jgi:hypothetical protein